MGGDDGEVSCLQSVRVSGEGSSGGGDKFFSGFRHILRHRYLLCRYVSSPLRVTSVEEKNGSQLTS